MFKPFLQFSPRPSSHRIRLLSCTSRVCQTDNHYRGSQNLGENTRATVANCLQLRELFAVTRTVCSYENCLQLRELFAVTRTVCSYENCLLLRELFAVSSIFEGKRLSFTKQMQILGNFSPVTLDFQL